MSINLKYLWIKEYGCFKNTGFQFDNEHEYSFFEPTGQLDIQSCPNELSSDFWHDSGRISNIHAIVGNNGHGKTTFLRAIIDIFTQIYPPEGTLTDAYKPPCLCPSIMVVGDDNHLLKILCIGTEVKQINSSVNIETETVVNNRQISDILLSVKLTFLSNTFDYRDYVTPKAHQISDYSFGGLLWNDYYKQTLYQRSDRQEDAISEQFYHSIYRQVSFMTEFYSEMTPEDQKRMFDSWPKSLNIKFIPRLGTEAERLCFHGVFKQVLENYNIESDKNTTSHGVSPLTFVENRLLPFLKNKQSEFKDPYKKIKYLLCRESFQNLLLIDNYRSFYQAPNYNVSEADLLPIVEIISKTIRKFLDSKEEIVLGMNQTFDFYSSLQESLKKLGKRNEGSTSYIAANYADMLYASLTLPYDLFDYEDYIQKGSFSFHLNHEKLSLFSEFLNHYKKIVLPYSFLSFDWGMSSGENNMLSLYSQLFAMREAEAGTNYHNTRIVNYVRKESENAHQNASHSLIPCDSVWILMDEADLTFHPSWQVEFISNLTWCLPQILPDKNSRIQLFFTTHSPILLSDIPRQNVVYLTKKADGIYASRNMLKNTFGQNIYTLFQDSFFIDGPMGKFSSSKICQLSEELLAIRKELENFNEYSISAEEVANYKEKLDNIRHRATLFGDKIVVQKFLTLIDISQYRLDGFLQKSNAMSATILDLQQKIEKLDEEKKQIEDQIKSLKKKGTKE